MAPIKNDAPRPVTTRSSQPAKTEEAKSTPAAASTAGWGLKGASTRATAAPAQLPTDPKQMAIVCPVLGALVKEGKVKMEADGTMKLKDLRTDGGASMNLTRPLQASLTAIGFIANKPGDVAHNMIHQEMNVLDLRTGMIKHPGDTAILTNGKFDEAKFNALASHAEGAVMTPDSFAKAIAANVQRDAKPGQILDTVVRGMNFSEVEFAGLISVFGKTDPQTGKFGIPVKELRELYENQKLPTLGDPSMIDTIALQASLKVKVDANLAGSAFGSTSTATGVSKAGARLAEGDRSSTAGGQASSSAGKAAACPHMNGVGKAPPPQVNDIVNAHTQAGIKDR